MRVKMRSTTPSVIALAGTNEPICAMIASRPVWRRYVDLPPMFGPVSRMKRCVASLQAQIVGHEVRVQNRFHHRMAPVFDRDDALFNEGRAHVAALGRALRERARARRSRRSRPPPRSSSSVRVADAVEQRFVELRFETLLARLRGRDRQLQLFELGRDVALAGRQRLLAHVVGRHAAGISSCSPRSHSRRRSRT